MASHARHAATQPRVRLQRPASLVMTTGLRIGYLYGLIWWALRPTIGVVLSNHSWVQRVLFIPLLLIICLVSMFVGILSVSSWIGEWTRRGDVKHHTFETECVPARAGQTVQGTIVWAPGFILLSELPFGRTRRPGNEIASDSMAGLLPGFNHVFINYPDGGLEEPLAFSRVISELKRGYDRNVIWFGLSYGEEVMARLAAYNDSLGSNGITSVLGLVSWSGTGGFWGLRLVQQIGLLVAFAFSGGPLWDKAWDWDQDKPNGRGLWRIFRQPEAERQHVVNIGKPGLTEMVHDGVREYRAMLTNMQALTRCGLLGTWRTRFHLTCPVVAVNLPPRRDQVLRVRRAMKILNRLFGNQPGQPTVIFCEYAAGSHGTVFEYAEECAKCFIDHVLPRLPAPAA